MKTEFDLNSFERNSNFYENIQLVVSIKSFDLQAIRARYLKSKANVSGKAGSVERRAVSKGGLAKLNIHQGKIEETKIVGELSEPRGIDYKAGRFAVSLENKVFVFQAEKNYIISNPWFSYIHTVDFHHEDDSRILITSSGFECLHEFDYKNSVLKWEWFAWDHGLNEANNPADNSAIILTRKPEEVEELRKLGKAFMHIADPSKDHLPTAKRAAFINTARYDSKDPESIFLTLFHEGSTRFLDKDSGESKILMDGMKSPHGSHRFDENTVIATNTAGGSVELLKGEKRTSIRFQNLPNKDPQLGNTEWLQNSIRHGSLIITIDSNRNSLVVFDIEQKKYDILAYNNNWAVQDLMVYNANSEGLINKAMSFLGDLNNPTN